MTLSVKTEQIMITALSFISFFKLQFDTIFTGSPELLKLVLSPQNKNETLSLCLLLVCSHKRISLLCVCGKASLLQQEWTDLKEPGDPADVPAGPSETDAVLRHHAGPSGLHQVNRSAPDKHLVYGEFNKFWCVFGESFIGALSLSVLRLITFWKSEDEDLFKRSKNKFKESNALIKRVIFIKCKEKLLCFYLKGTLKLFNRHRLWWNMFHLKAQRPWYKPELLGFCIIPR